MLILIRGLPGSGKSTMAQQFAKAGFIHCEADSYFMKDGVYEYDATKRGEAHSECRAKAELGLMIGEKVVVSNTFTMKWEMEPYVAMAKEHNVPLIVLEALGQFKNVHGVPEEAIQRMRDRWETL